MGWAVNEAAVDLGAWEAGGRTLGGFQPLGDGWRLESADPWGGKGRVWVVRRRSVITRRDDDCNGVAQ
jgi:hypothetical protein